MNKKGIVQFMLFAVFTGVILLMMTLGGFGLVRGLFKGLTSIPPIVYIVGSVLIVLILIKGLK